MRSERNHPSFMLISLGLAIFAAQLLTAAQGKARPGLSSPAPGTQAPTLDEAVLAKAYRFESARQRPQREDLQSPLPSSWCVSWAEQRFIIPWRTPPRQSRERLPHADGRYAGSWLIGTVKNNR